MEQEKIKYFKFKLKSEIKGENVRLISS